MKRQFVMCKSPPAELFWELVRKRGVPDEVFHDPFLDHGYGGIAVLYKRDERAFAFVGSGAFRVGYRGSAPRELLAVLETLGSKMTIEDIANLDHTNYHTLWRAL